MFVDSVKVYAKAGKGGNGCIAFSHEPFLFPERRSEGDLFWARQ